MSKSNLRKANGSSQPSAPSPTSPVSSDPSAIAAHHKQLGVTAFTCQRYSDAIHHFSQAITATPTDATLFNNRSAALAASEQFNSALKDAERACELRKDWGKTHYRRGVALEGLMRYHEALQAYECGLKLEPADSLLQKSKTEVELIVEELKNGEIVTSEEGKIKVNPENDKFHCLIEWLLNGGARFPALYLKYYDRDYRGVHAVRDLKKDTCILYIPHSHIMTSEIAKASNIGKAIIESKVELSSTHSFLASFLLQEKHAGSQSFWAPYINILPHDYHYMPIFFSSLELAELKGSFTLQKIKERRDELREEYDNLCKFVGAEFSRFTHNEFVWARLVVITRIFGLVISGHKTDGLVPYADMLNHMRPRQSSWTYNDQVKGFTITTLQQMQRGEQVYDSYGRKCNSRFFVNYGFALTENEDNQCCLLLSLPETDSHFDMKLRLLQAAKFGPFKDRRFQIPVDYREDVTKECFSFLRFVHAKDSELILLNSDSAQFDIKKIEPISMRNELAVLKTLHDTAKATLEEFPTSIEEDEKLLKNEALSFNMRNIIIMRKGEKEVLKYYVDLYTYVLSLTAMEWKDFKRLVHRCYENKNKTDPYVTAVVHPLMKYYENKQT